VSDKPIDWSKPVQTRDGSPVRIFCIDAKTDYGSIIGLVHNGASNSENACLWYANGHLSKTGESRMDLINVPGHKKKIHREVWINLYPEDAGDICHTNIGQATRQAADDRIACIKVVIDCEEGDGLGDAPQTHT
jgi:hypothetical protein